MTSQADQPSSDAMLKESVVLLNSAVDVGNWSLVNDLLSKGDVDIRDVIHSSLLQKLASSRGDTQMRVRNIVNKAFSSENVTNELKIIGENTVVKIATDDNWDTFIDFLSETKSLLRDNIILVTIVQSMVTSQTLRTKPYLHMDVFTSLWRNSKQNILDCEEQSVHNTLVQLAAELNMWSRVCDLLEVKPDLNVLDRDGLSVLHRLVMCPDSRFDSLLAVLLEHGADVRFRNSKGESALHLAAKHQNIVHPSENSDQAKTNDKSQCSKTEIMNDYRRKRIDSKLKALERLIQSCDNLDDRDEEGNTAAIVAVNNDNWEFLKQLIKHGALVDIPDGYQRSVLHVLALKRPAMDSKTCECVAVLCVNNGAQVNRTDMDGNSPLHLAVQSGNWTLFETFVSLGAQPELSDAAGYNVLYRLAMTTSDQIQHVCPLFVLLHDRGANMNTRCPAGDTILHLAAKCGNLMLVEYLINLCSDVNHSNRKGFTVLHILAFSKVRVSQGEQCSGDQLGNTEHTYFLSILDHLIDKGANLNHRCLTDDTALQLAARHQNWTVFKHLLQRGAKIHEADSEGITVMQRFVHSRLEPSETQSIFQILLQHSAVTNTRNSRGDSVLQLAAKHGKWSVVDHMVRHLVENADERDSEGFMIIDRAVLSLEHALSKWFSPSYCTYSLELMKKATNCELSSLVHMADRSQTGDVLNVVLDVFENVNVTDDEGFTPLHRVAQHRAENPSALISRLVQKGAHVDIRCGNGNTAIQLAAKSNNWRAVQELLRYGVSVSGVDNEGNSVLHRLMGQAHLLCEQCKQGTATKKLVVLLVILLFKGALIDEKDHHGNTPLHLAVRHEQWGMAIELLARGASLTERDYEGCTILHLLAKRSNSVNVELFSCQSESSTSQPHKVDSHFVTRMPSIDSCVACSLDDNEEPPFLFLSSSLAKQNFNHLDMCEHFIKQTNLVDASDCHGNTALLLSAKHNNCDVTQTLLVAGANPSLMNSEGFLLLHALSAVSPACVDGLLAENSQTDILNHWISRSADVRARDPEGNTPIQLAARHGNMDMVKLLLDFSENVNETDSEGFTLLSRVAQTPSPESEDIASSLLEKDADAHISCPDGKTPITISVLSRNWSVLWPLLLNSDISQEQVLQEDILIRLIEDSCTGDAYLPENESLMKMLMMWVHRRRSDGVSAKQLAVMTRQWDIVSKLYDCGHYTDTEPLLGEMVFHGLAESVLHANQDDLDSISAMMPNHKLNMDLRDESGETPLNIFACTDRWDLVKLFVDHGADVRLPDSEGWTVLQRLVMTDEWYGMGTHPSELLSMLLERGSDINKAGPEGKTPVMMALEEKRWPVFWHLLQLGAEFDWANCDKRLILHNIYSMPRKHSQEEKLTQIVKHLTETRPGLTFVETDCVCCGQRAFEICVMLSRWTVAKVLLQSEAEIDITRLVNGHSQLLHKMSSLYKDDDHDTWMSLLNTLLARGLDINCRNDKGKTVLMKRKVLHRLIDPQIVTGDLFTTLLAKGCNPLLADDMGDTVLTQALDFGTEHALTTVISLVKLGVIFHLPQIDSLIANGDCCEPTTKAARIKNISILKILIECGVCSNSQLFSLSEEFETHKAVEAQSDTQVHKICQILEKAATQPRSLESLCRLAVSRAVPYSLDRTDMIMSLSIPHPLKEYMMFTDVTGDCAVDEETENRRNRRQPCYYCILDDDDDDEDDDPYDSDFWR